MSYQQSYTTSGTHRLAEFVPNYVPHSDYLPTNRVSDNQQEANQWVPFPFIFSCPTMNNRKDSATSTPPNLRNSIPGDTSQSGPTKTSSSISPSPKTSSTAESEGTEPVIRIPITYYILTIIIIYLLSTHLLSLKIFLPLFSSSSQLKNPILKK